MKYLLLLFKYIGVYLGIGTVLASITGFLLTRSEKKGQYYGSAGAGVVVTMFIAWPIGIALGIKWAIQDGWKKFR